MKVFRTVHDLDDYVNESNMNYLGQWTTEVEIIATASIFATDIYVFIPCGTINKWIRYGPLRGATELTDRSNCKMYISNLSEHFVPVLDA